MTQKRSSPPPLPTRCPPHLLSPVEEALAVGTHTEGLLDLLPQTFNLGETAQIINSVGLSAVYGTNLDPHGARLPLAQLPAVKGRSSSSAL